MNCNRGSNKERLEWMYSAGPAQHQDFIDQEKEDYLLGKRKIDAGTFKGKEEVGISLITVTKRTTPWQK